MRIFISWSGIKSRKVALVFKDWLPSVIQSLSPYVSSEDIDKGTRWSTDIASELENSKFGILCVTKDNVEAPWLLFEAGALSKSMDKSYVSPFLFDIKGSEIKKNPILQFQATIFQKDDIKKLLQTINSACSEHCLSDLKLNEAFEVWYPRLETRLNEIKESKNDETEDDDSSSNHKSEILEEILGVVRNNQIILKNPDNKTVEKLDAIQNLLRSKITSSERFEMRKSSIKTEMAFDEFLNYERKNPYAILMILGLFNSEYPWVYEAGVQLVTTIKSRASRENKIKAMEGFARLTDFTFDHPAVRDIYGERDYRSMYKLSRLILDYLDHEYLRG